MSRIIVTTAWVVSLVSVWAGAWYVDRRRPSGRSVVASYGPTVSAQTEFVALVAIFMLAAALRCLLLSDQPPFINNDESMFGYEATWRPEYPDLFGMSLLRHWPRWWIPDLFKVGWTSTLTMNYFIHWAPSLLLGMSLPSIRLGGAILGLVAIWVQFRWVRRWWGPATALVAALCFALSDQHIYWNRLAEQCGDGALAGACALAALAWALDTGLRRAWVALGLAIGGGIYTYIAANLHGPIVACILIATGTVISDWRGVLLALGVAALTIAPMIPAFLAPNGWASWFGYGQGVFSEVPVSALLHGNWKAVTDFLRQHSSDTALMFGATPVMNTLVWLGILAAVCMNTRATRIALFWLACVVCCGAATIGFRSARLVVASPVLSLMPAMLFASTWSIAGGAPLFVRRFLSLVGVVLLCVATYEAWSAQFVQRAKYHNITYDLCHAIQQVGLPTTIFVLGHNGSEPSYDPREAMNKCLVVPDPARKFVDTSDVPEMARTDMAIVFPDMQPKVQEFLARYPLAHVNSIVSQGHTPFMWSAQGTDSSQPGSLEFVTIRIPHDAQKNLAK